MRATFRRLPVVGVDALEDSFRPVRIGGESVENLGDRVECFNRRDELSNRAVEGFNRASQVLARAV